MKLSLKTFLLSFGIGLAIIPLLIVGLVSLNFSYSAGLDSAYKQLEQTAVDIQDKVKTAHSSILENYEIKADLIHEKLLISGGFVVDDSETIELAVREQVTAAGQTITVPVLRMGNQEIYENNDLVDEIGELTKTRINLYQKAAPGFIRTSTSITDNTGQRVTNTYIPNSDPIAAELAAGRSVAGVAFIIDSYYFAYKKPVFDETGQVIGALAVVLPVEEAQNDILNRLSDLVIGKTGYPFILDVEGNYILSKNRERDGENIYDATDANGNLFVQQMIVESTSKDFGEFTIMSYDWSNSASDPAREKLAYVTYFPEWGWVIASSTYTEEYLDGYNSTKNTVITSGLIVAIIAILLSIFFAFIISKPIGHMVRITERVSEGDLREKVQMNSFVRELATLGSKFDLMVDNLVSMVSKIADSSDDSAKSSSSLSASAQEVNASMEQVSSTIQEIAKGAQELSKLTNDSATKSRDASDTAKTGASSAKEVQQKMSSLQSTTNETSESVRALSEQSKKIGEIVNTINDISEQTNLLALNAAIEAARAGDAGRGFAVVADEVRKLAEESQTSTAEIGTLIQNIQSEIVTATEKMGVNSKEVLSASESVELAVKSFEAIPEIVDSVSKSLDSVSSIAEENAAGSEEVTASVNEVTNAMQEVANSSEKMNKIADEMKAYSEKFKLEK